VSHSLAELTYKSLILLGDRLTVGLQTLTLPI
jgi:hypothetical protein